MLQVLGALHAIHSLCIFFHVLRPRLQVATGALSGTTSIILLNAMNLAVACRCALAACFTPLDFCVHSGMYSMAACLKPE